MIIPLYSVIEGTRVFYSEEEEAEERDPITLYSYLERGCSKEDVSLLYSNGPGFASHRNQAKQTVNHGILKSKRMK